MKLKLAILLLVCVVAGLGCTDSGTGARTSPSATPGLGTVQPQQVPTITPK
jgi:hypothetical protein